MPFNQFKQLDIKVTSLPMETLYITIGSRHRGHHNSNHPCNSYNTEWGRLFSSFYSVVWLAPFNLPWSTDVFMIRVWLEPGMAVADIFSAYYQHSYWGKS